MKIHWAGLEDELWELHEDHPGWSTKRLAEEMALPWKAVDNHLYLLKNAREQHWLDHCRIGFLDIETTDLKANVGFMICWGLLLPDGTVLSDLITRREVMGPAIEPDRRVVASCLKALKSVDCIIGYNSSIFDIPFLRTRALAHGLSFPAYGQLLQLDLYFAAKSLLRTTNKRLGTISEFLGLTDKDSYSIRRWNMARRGDEQALKDIFSHNISDLHITEDLFIALGPFRKWLRKSV